MIAHRLSSITNADSIYVMHRGRIVESGTHRELLEKNGLFSHMWKNYSEAAEWKIAKEAESMIQKLQRRFALSRQGAVDLIKGCLACVLQDISFMFPVGLLYQFVIDFMNGGVSRRQSGVLCDGLSGLPRVYLRRFLFQYNATYLAT